MPYQLKKAAEMKRQTTVRNQNEAQTSNSVARIDLSESETNEYWEEEEAEKKDFLYSNNSATLRRLIALESKENEEH